MYYSWILFSLHIFQVLKWFGNHQIPYLSSFPRIFVLALKIVQKRRYANLTFGHVFLFELFCYIFKFPIVKYLKISKELSLGISEWNLDHYIFAIILLKSSFILAKKNLFSYVYITSEICREISRFACARAQHVILGMLAAMNTRKACYMG